MILRYVSSGSDEHDGDTTVEQVRSDSALIEVRIMIPSTMGHKTKLSGDVVTE
jgi:hypothetical protein